MTTSEQIQNTPTYKSLVERDKFLEGILTNAKSRKSIDYIVELIKSHGVKYLEDKNLSERETKIAMEVLGL